MTVAERRQDGPEGPRRRITFFVKLACSAGLLAWIISRADLNSVLEAWSAADYRWLLLCLLMPYIGMLIAAWRWAGLLRELDIRLPFAYLFASYLVSSFFKQFLPSTIGGDAVRAYDCWRAGASKTATLLSLVVDRLIGAFSLVVFAVAAIGLSKELTARQPSLYLWVGLIAGVLVAGVYFLFSSSDRLVRIEQSFLGILPDRLSGFVSKALNALRAYRGRKAGLARALAISFVMQIHVITFYYLVSLALGFRVSFINFCLIVPVALLIMLIPVSINGIGLREGVFVLLLAPFGVETSQALAFAWIEYATLLLAGLVGGVVYAFRRSTAPVPGPDSVDRMPR